MNRQGAATQMRLCNHDRCIDPTMTKHLTKPIRAICFLVLAFLMTLGTQGSAVGKSWIIVFGSTTVGKIDIGIASFFAHNFPFSTKQHCEQFLLDKFIVELDGWYVEKSFDGNDLVARNKDDTIGATVYKCISVAHQ